MNNNRDELFDLLTEKDAQEERPVCEPAADVKDDDSDEHECCVGCGEFYDGDSIMVVDDVGPICFNCCYHVIQATLGE